MPRNYTEEENDLINCLEEYWQIQKFFYLSAIDCLGIMAWRRETSFKSEQYIGDLALKIAKYVCVSDDREWQKILEHHGFFSDFESRNSSTYLVNITRCLQKITITQQQHQSLKDAINMVNDEKYKTKIQKRLTQIRRSYPDAAPSHMRRNARKPSFTVSRFQI